MTPHVPKIISLLREFFSSYLPGTLMYLYLLINNSLIFLLIINLFAFGIPIIKFVIILLQVMAGIIINFKRVLSSYLKLYFIIYYY